MFFRRVKMKKIYHMVAAALFFWRKQQRYRRKVLLGSLEVFIWIR
jgi:hypothetical protein